MIPGWLAALAYALQALAFAFVIYQIQLRHKREVRDIERTAGGNLKDLWDENAELRAQNDLLASIVGGVNAYRNEMYVTREEFME